MTIAAKGIASCSPIASQSCITAPLIPDYFGDTSEVYESFLATGFVVAYFGNASLIYIPTLVDPTAGQGDCIIAHAFHHYTYACPLLDDASTPVPLDDADTPARDDEITAPPWQKCNKEAA